MTPNATSVTLQEIASLADVIGKIFGAYEQSDIALEPFLAPERIVQMLIVVSAEGHRFITEGNLVGFLFQAHRQLAPDNRHILRIDAAGHALFNARDAAVNTGQKRKILRPNSVWA